MRTIVLLVALASLAACTGEAEAPRPIGPTATAAPPAPPSVLRAEAVESPAGQGSAQPGLSVDGRGRALLSWIEPLSSGGRALRFSAWEGGRWSLPRVISEGSAILANWADTPSMAAAGDGTLAAAWPGLQREGSEGYDVRIALSPDGGETWGASLTPHRDGTETEHDFASLVRATGGLVAIWLDGRSHAGAGHAAGHAGGEQALMSATLAPDGALGPEVTLDSRVCDCCATAAVPTRDGLLVAYRDRSADEVRDIAVVRHDSGGWSAPRIVHADGWRIAGCPVNGPALAADGDRVALAWFSEPDGGARVQMTLSTDGGMTFGAAVRIDDGHPLGRVDVVLLEDGSALVGWLELEGDTASFRAKAVSAAGQGEIVRIATMESARASGFPRLIRAGGHALAAWTAREGETTRVMTALVR